MTDTTKPELLPCPFCGGEAYLASGECGRAGMSMKARNPRCGACGVEMGYCKDSQAATKAWNTRASPWLPIADAPRDGTILDLKHKDGFRITEEWWTGDDGWTCGIADEDFTHYMRCPHIIQDPTPPNTGGE